ncbi:polysaccharide biosynthesis/export family protein [Croceiramulus getboli]|nr:polysaccharide biosynthesis/export family protein [Flavobacteriaceae bacterium YJPT1-3]
MNGFRALTAILLAFLLHACIPTKDLTYLQEDQQADTTPLIVKRQSPPYRVQINDVLSIRIKALDQDLVALFNPAASEIGSAVGEGYYYDGFAVDRHGKIRVPTLGEVPVLGMTTEEIRLKIEELLLQDYFKEEANIFVSVKMAGINYTVLGEVGSPGTKVELTEELNVLQAIANSGDIPITGDRTDVIIIRQYPGGQRIHHIDLTTIDAMNSPYYILQPNDTIIVNPLPQKSIGAGTTGLQSFTTILSVVTALASVVLLFISL